MYNNSVTLCFDDLLPYAELGSKYVSDESDSDVEDPEVVALLHERVVKVKKEIDWDNEELKLQEKKKKKAIESKQCLSSDDSDSDHYDAVGWCSDRESGRGNGAWPSTNLSECGRPVMPVSHYKKDESLMSLPIGSCEDDYSETNCSSHVDSEINSLNNEDNAAFADNLKTETDQVIDRRLTDQSERPAVVCSDYPTCSSGHDVDSGDSEGTDSYTNALTLCSSEPDIDGVGISTSPSNQLICQSMPLSVRTSRCTPSPKSLSRTCSSGQLVRSINKAQVKTSGQPSKNTFFQSGQLSVHRMKMNEGAEDGKRGCSAPATPLKPYSKVKLKLESETESQVDSDLESGLEPFPCGSLSQMDDDNELLSGYESGYMQEPEHTISHTLSLSPVRSPLPPSPSGNFTSATCGCTCTAESTMSAKWLDNSDSSVTVAVNDTRRISTSTPVTMKMKSLQLSLRRTNLVEKPAIMAAQCSNSTIDVSPPRMATLADHVTSSDISTPPRGNSSTDHMTDSHIGTLASLQLSTDHVTSSVIDVHTPPRGISSTGQMTDHIGTLAGMPLPIDHVTSSAIDVHTPPRGNSSTVHNETSSAMQTSMFGDSSESTFVEPIQVPAMLQEPSSPDNLTTSTALTPHWTSPPAGHMTISAPLGSRRESSDAACGHTTDSVGRILVSEVQTQTEHTDVVSTLCDVKTGGTSEMQLSTSCECQSEQASELVHTQKPFNVEHEDCLVVGQRRARSELPCSQRRCGYGYPQPPGQQEGWVAASACVSEPNTLSTSYDGTCTQQQNSRGCQSDASPSCSCLSCQQHQCHQLHQLPQIRQPHQPHHPSQLQPNQPHQLHTPEDLHQHHQPHQPPQLHQPHQPHQPHQGHSHCLSCQPAVLPLQSQDTEYSTTQGNHTHIVPPCPPHSHTTSLGCKSPPGQADHTHIPSLTHQESHTHSMTSCPSCSRTKTSCLDPHAMPPCASHSQVQDHVSVLVPQPQGVHKSSHCSHSSLGPSYNNPIPIPHFRAESDSHTHSASRCLHIGCPSHGNISSNQTHTPGQHWNQTYNPAGQHGNQTYTPGQYGNQTHTPSQHVNQTYAVPPSHTHLPDTYHSHASRSFVQGVNHAHQMQSSSSSAHSFIPSSNPHVNRVASTQIHSGNQDNGVLSCPSHSTHVSDNSLMRRPEQGIGHTHTLLDCPSHSSVLSSPPKLISSRKKRPFDTNCPCLSPMKFQHLAPHNASHNNSYKRVRKEDGIETEACCASQAPCQLPAKRHRS